MRATRIGVKSPFLPVAAPLAALIASLVRWWLQGSNNLYTAIDKRFFVPDPDLGWRVSSAHPVWLGLEVCAVIAAIAVGIAIGGWMIRQRESKRAARATVLRAVAWVLGAVSLAAPIAAYASGSRPTGARDALPIELAKVPATNAIAGRLEAPSGRYEVVAHEGTSITAHLSAGGEAFDARFTGDVQGFWHGNPHDLNDPMSADVSVAAASIDTGVRDRSKHARTAYLEADTYPRIEVTLDRVLAAQPAGRDAVAFSAHGTLSLIGRKHSIEIAGTLVQPDDAARARLGLTGSILLVKATFSIAIKETALAADAGDFDGDLIPIAVSLVLRHTND
jgi:polyisoprenoid-binding protein YceI